MRRLYFSIIITVVGSLFAITWGLDKIVAKQVPTETRNEYAIYHQLIEGFNQQLGQQPFDELEKFTNQLAEDYQFALSLDDSKNIALPAELSEQLTQPGGLLLASGSQPYLLKKLTLYPDYVIQLPLPLEPVENKHINILLTVALYLGVCSILLAWLFPLTRRLYLLTSTAAQIGAGDLNARMPSSRFSYIRSLEHSFNRMATHIEKLVADNKILARSMSHDIRTPMSCLRFGVEAAIDTQDIVKKDHYLARMETELTRMEDMTTAFLEYAGMERQGFHLKNEMIDLNHLINTVCHDFQSLAEQYNVKLTSVLLPKNTEYSLDYHWCYRAIQNLISNAIQYADQQVRLSISLDNTQLKILVEDDGKGLPLDSIESIFDPFVKLDVNRSRELGHFGLGLAITAKVVHWHNGRIKAGNSDELSGACFTIAFPLQHDYAKKLNTNKSH
jgi:signal transduction histidine kinase